LLILFSPNWPGPFALLIQTIRMLQKVLIIDDEKDLCELLEFYFKKKNYEVHVYHFLKEGLLAVDQFAPCHVFLDNNLPDGLGWEKINELIEKFPAIRLHLLSGYNYSAMSFPKEAHIKIWQKPVTYADLDIYF
jgi:two-component system OmpR family response regulator